MPQVIHGASKYKIGGRECTTSGSRGLEMFSSFQCEWDIYLSVYQRLVSQITWRGIGGKCGFWVGDVGDGYIHTIN